MAARGKRKEVYTYEVGGNRGREKRRGRYIAEELKAKPPTFKYCLEMNTNGSRAATKSSTKLGTPRWLFGVGAGVRVSPCGKEVYPNVPPIKSRLAVHWTLDVSVNME